MNALVQFVAVARQTKRLSDFGVVTVFSLIGIVLTLIVAHFGARRRSVNGDLPGIFPIVFSE